jgi:signal recognition particle subunit SRP54
MTFHPFTLKDFLDQMEQVQAYVSTDGAVCSVPGMAELMKQIKFQPSDVLRQINHMKGLYSSMNELEREVPELLDERRRQRIARGAGVGARELEQFLQQFEQAHAVMRAVWNMRA